MRDIGRAQETARASGEISAKSRRRHAEQQPRIAVAAAVSPSDVLTAGMSFDFCAVRSVNDSGVHAEKTVSINFIKIKEIYLLDCGSGEINFLFNKHTTLSGFPGNFIVWLEKFTI